MDMISIVTSGVAMVTIFFLSFFLRGAARTDISLHAVPASSPGECSDLQRSNSAEHPIPGPERLSFLLCVAIVFHGHLHVFSH